jgi:hypothetical protein
VRAVPGYGPLISEIRSQLAVRTYDMSNTIGEGDRCDFTKLSVTAPLGSDDKDDTDSCWTLILPLTLPDDVEAAPLNRAGIRETCLPTHRCR